MSLFTSYTWKNRTGTKINRRTLTDTTTSASTTYDIERAEGTVYEQGMEFNATLMNNIEGRIAQAFDKIDELLDSSQYLETFYPVGSIYLSYSSTSPATALGGGTWQKLTGALLLPSDEIPANMISNFPNNLQYIGQDSVSVTPTGSVTFKSTSGYTHNAKADMPQHTHSYTDRGNNAKTAGKSVGFYNKFKQKTVLNKDSYVGKTRTSGKTGDNSTGHNHQFTGSGSFVGNSQSIDVRQAAITICAWVRTA
jgi:hypothetical protein